MTRSSPISRGWSRRWTHDGDVENGVTIAPIVHELVEPMVINFNQADTDAAKWRRSRRHSGPTTEQMVSFAGDQTVTFASDPAVTELLRKLNATPGVFTANTPEKAPRCRRRPQ